MTIFLKPQEFIDHSQGYCIFRCTLGRSYWQDNMKKSDFEGSTKRAEKATLFAVDMALKELADQKEESETPK